MIHSLLRISTFTFLCLLSFYTLPDIILDAVERLPLEAVGPLYAVGFCVMTWAVYCLLGLLASGHNHSSEAASPPRDS